MRWFDRFNATYQPIPTVGLGLGLSSFFADSSWDLWVLTMAFAWVYSAATGLFERIVARATVATGQGWIRSTLLVAVGMGLGVGHALIPASLVGVAVLMVFAVVLAWMFTAWWQRWVERRVYRGTFSRPMIEPEGLETLQT